MIWNLLYRQGWSQIYQDPMLRYLIIIDYSILCIGNKLKTKNRMFNFQTTRKTKIKEKMDSIYAKGYKQRKILIKQQKQCKHVPNHNRSNLMTKDTAGTYIHKTTKGNANMFLVTINMIALKCLIKKNNLLGLVGLLISTVKVY